MRMNVYTVRDSQSEAAMRPVFFERDAVAIRSFKLSVTNADDPMANAPDDYILYRIGEYDDETMLIKGYDPVRLIGGLEAIADRAIDKEKIEALQKEIKALEEK